MWSASAVALDLKRKLAIKSRVQIHCACQHFQSLQHVRVVWGGFSQDYADDDDDDFHLLRCAIASVQPREPQK